MHFWKDWRDCRKDTSWVLMDLQLRLKESKCWRCLLEMLGLGDLETVEIMGWARSSSSSIDSTFASWGWGKCYSSELSAHYSSDSSKYSISSPSPSKVEINLERWLLLSANWSWYALNRFSLTIELGKSLKLGVRMSLIFSLSGSCLCWNCLENVADCASGLASGPKWEMLA